LVGVLDCGLKPQKYKKEGITMMTKKEKEFAMFLANAVVEAMKATSATPVSANKGRKSATANEGKKTATPTTKYSTKLADYEPKKVDGFYKWGKKTDTIKSRNYRAMQIAYCYAVATKGQAISSDECLNLGIEVDYSENGAYGKAKAQFKKKFVYTKKADR
jgi:hypothetical protein